MYKAPMLVDAEGSCVSWTDDHAYKVFRIMSFSREVVNRYGLASESIKDAKDLDARLDRAIKGLETEIGLK